MPADHASESIRNDNLWRLMIRLSIPAIVGMALISVNILVDMIFVGHYVGEKGIAAISRSSTYTSLLFAFSMLVSEGSASLLSRSIGSRDTKIQSLVFSNMTAMAVIAGILLLIVSFFSRDLINWTGAEGVILDSGAEYLAITLAGGFFNVYGFAMNWLIRAEGKIRTAMTFTGMSMLVNIILDAVLIAGLDMGTRGAAIASLLSIISYMLFNLSYFIAGKASFPYSFKDIRIKGEIIKDVLSTGFASFVINMTGLIQLYCVFNIISEYNAVKETAIFGAVYRIFWILLIPSYGIVRAFQPVVGINYGAKQLKRVKEAVGIYTLGGILFSAVIWIPIMLMPEQIIRIIIPEISLDETDIRNIRIFFCLFPLHPISAICISFLQSMGHGKTSTYLTISQQIIVFIPLLYTLTHFYQSTGVYQTYMISNLGMIIVCLFIIAYHFRQFNKATSS